MDGPACYYPFFTSILSTTAKPLPHKKINSWLCSEPLSSRKATAAACMEVHLAWPHHCQWRKKVKETSKALGMDGLKNRLVWVQPDPLELSLQSLDGRGKAHLIWWAGGQKQLWKFMEVVKFHFVTPVQRKKFKIGMPFSCCMSAKKWDGGS